LPEVLARLLGAALAGVELAREHVAPRDHERVLGDLGERPRVVDRLERLVGVAPVPGDPRRLPRDGDPDLGRRDPLGAPARLVERLLRPLEGACRGERGGEEHAEPDLLDRVALLRVRRLDRVL
jgi:hypothetical protein